MTKNEGSFFFKKIGKGGSPCLYSIGRAHNQLTHVFCIFGSTKKSDPRKKRCYEFYLEKIDNDALKNSVFNKYNARNQFVSEFCFLKSIIYNDFGVSR